MADIKALAAAIEAYHVDNSVYPAGRLRLGHLHDAGTASRHRFVHEPHAHLHRAAAGPGRLGPLHAVQRGRGGSQLQRPQPRAQRRGQRDRLRHDDQLQPGHPLLRRHLPAVARGNAGLVCSERFRIGACCSADGSSPGFRGRGARSRPSSGSSRPCWPGGRLRSATRATSSIRSSSTRPSGCARGRSRSGTRSPAPGSPGSPTGSRASSIRRPSCSCSPPRRWRGRSFCCCTSRIAAWGARRFLKEENVSDAGALFGAAAFAASGFAASLSVYWNHFGAWAYLPAIAALARSGFRSRAATLGFGALVGLQAMAGSPEISAATVVLAAALAWSPRAEFPEPHSPQPRAVRLRRYAAGVGLGLALAALGDRAHGGARPALRPPPRVLRGGARRGAVGRRDAGIDVRVHARVLRRRRISRRSFCRPSCWSPRRRRFARSTAAASRCCSRSSPRSESCSPRRAPPGAWLRQLPPLDRIRYPAKWLVVELVRGRRCWRGSASTPCAFRPARPAARALFGAAAVAALGAAALSPLSPPVRLCCCVGAAALGFLALGLGRRPLAGAAARRGGGRGPGRARSPWRSRPLPRFAAEAQADVAARSPWRRSPACRAA